MQMKQLKNEPVNVIRVSAGTNIDHLVYVSGGRIQLADLHRSGSTQGQKEGRGLFTSS